MSGNPNPTTSYTTDQYLRKCGLIVSGGSTGYDLSNMRIVFQTVQSDGQTPNYAIIRVYNLSDQTIQNIFQTTGVQPAGSPAAPVGAAGPPEMTAASTGPAGGASPASASNGGWGTNPEFAQVSLQAGYQTGKYGVIFQGTIKQFKSGREMGPGGVVDTYLDIFAADGDKMYNFGIINDKVPKGGGPQDVLDALNKAAAAYGITPGYQLLSGTGGVSPQVFDRSKPLYGMIRDTARQLAASTGTSWSIQNGQLTFIPLQGYKPGEAVVLNARSGLIGLPESTQQGVTAHCLLNPAIVCGQLVQINNGDINQVFTPGGAPSMFPGFSDLNFFASVTADGIYKALVVEFRGDTRGQPWYTDLVLFAVDLSGQSTSGAQQVQDGSYLPSG